MNLQVGTWIEQRHGDFSSYLVGYILGANGREPRVGYTYDVLTLKIIGGIYSGGARIRSLSLEGWDSIEEPPFAERHALVVVFA